MAEIIINCFGVDGIPPLGENHGVVKQKIVSGTIKFSCTKLQDDGSCGITLRGPSAQCRFARTDLGSEDLKSMADRNTKAALAIIQQCQLDGKPVSMSDVARMTGLSKATVSSIIDDLQHGLPNVGRQLTTLLGSSTRVGGRIPQLLQIVDS